MQKTIVLLLALFCAGNTYSQSLKKYSIGNSGCSVYMFCDPGTFSADKSPDSSDVYTGECKGSDGNYGIICVRLKDKIGDLASAEGVLVQYLDYLKGSMKIKNAAGYGKGRRLKDREDTRGMIDYWQDEDKNNYKIGAWTDGKYLAVLYVYSDKEVPETRANVFIESFRMPGM